MAPLRSDGKARVYQATDSKLADSPCVICEISQAMEREIQVLSALDHAGIPRLRDAFQEAGGGYVVMELVQGKSLEEELADHLHLTEEAMDPPVVALDMVGLLETLSYLHQRSPAVLHGDIKPSHLIRDQRSGKIKLVNLGLAPTAGSPGFAAPEQLKGRTETASDLYAVGAVLYHLCTGKAPDSSPPLSPEWPENAGLSAIIRRATQPDPAQRYASAAHMAEDLRSWLRDPKAPLAPLPVTPASSSRTSKAPLLLALALTVGLLMGVAWKRNRPTPALQFREVAPQSWARGREYLTFSAAPLAARRPTRRLADYQHWVGESGELFYRPDHSGWEIVVFRQGWEGQGWVAQLNEETRSALFQLELPSGSRRSSRLAR